MVAYRIEISGWKSDGFVGNGGPVTPHKTSLSAIDPGEEARSAGGSCLSLLMC